MKYRIPFIKPLFPSGAEIGSDYDKIVASNWFTNFGPYEQQFRNEIIKFLKQDIEVSTVANATLAIDLAIRSLFSKTEKRTQVLVPSFTFAAGPEMLVSNGYTPVFIDINKNSWQPDILQAENYLKLNADKMSGILLCNIFGVGNRQIEEWEKIAKRFELPLVIDSAAGFGSKYEDNIYIGGRGDCEIFSLHATKPFAVGEGGLIVSKHTWLIDKVRSLQNFGFDDHRDISAIGTNAKLQELNCAIGLRQLKEFDVRLSGRQESLAYYKKGLAAIGYSFQDNDNNSTVAFVSVLAPNKAVAEHTYAYLLENNIEAKRYYSPLHKQLIFNRITIIAATLSNTEDIASRIISLPLHDNMNKGTIDDIVAKMRNAQQLIS